MQQIEQALFGITVAAYMAAAVLTALELAYRNRDAGRWADRLLVAGLVAHTGGLGVRWAEVGRPPIASLHETLIALSWFLVVLFLLVGLRYRVKVAGLALIPAAFFMVGTALLLYEQPRPLQEELQSPWLGIHVGLTLLAYASFVLGSAMAFFYVVQEDLLKKNYSGVRMLVGLLTVAFGTGFGIYAGYLIADPTLFEDFAGNRVYAYSGSDWMIIGIGGVAGLVLSSIAGWVAARGASRPSFANRLPALHLLDQVSFRSVVAGFVLLGLGMVSGVLWAQQAWGEGWVWDPKETWALVAWLFYGGYLGFRHFANWRGRYAAVLAMVGLLFIVLAFLGVNLFFPGRHDFN